MTGTAAGEKAIAKAGPKTVKKPMPYA